MNDRLLGSSSSRRRDLYAKGLAYSNEDSTR
jgi:hypothetical protein